MVNHSSRVETAVQVLRAARVYRVKRVLRDNGVLEEKEASTQLRRVITKAGQARTVSLHFSYLESSFYQVKLDIGSERY
jgi:secreted trypsin-like serine protease